MTPLIIYAQKRGLIVCGYKKYGPASIVDPNVFYFDWTSDPGILAKSAISILESAIESITDQAEFIRIQSALKNLQCINVPGKVLKLAKSASCVSVSHSVDGAGFNVVIFPKISAASYAKFVNSGQSSPQQKFDYSFTTFESFGLDLFSWSKRAVDWIWD